MKKIVVTTMAAVLTLTGALTEAVSVQAAEGEDYVTVAQADGNVSQDSVDRANDLLNVLPAELLEYFNDEGWHFYVTDKNIASTFFAGQFNSVMGVTDFDNKEIYIEQRNAAVENAVVHEFGHYLDYIDGTLSQTQEFANVFNAESNAFVQAFNVNFYYDIGEFLADGIFRYYDGERDTLSQACPRLTSYIEDMIEIRPGAFGDGE